MKSFLIAILLPLLVASSASAAEVDAQAYFREGQRHEKRANYFQAARYYFQALQRTEDRGQQNVLNADISNMLVAARMYQSASYFFLKAVEGGDDRGVRLALSSVEPLMENVGSEIFQKYLVKYTREYQYPSAMRDYYFYAVAKDRLLKNQHQDVIRAVNEIGKSFVDYPSALFLRGTAQLMNGDVHKGIDDFKRCADTAENSSYTKHLTKSEAKELKNRCTAGVARGYYQNREYSAADDWYDKVEMNSFVWPQVQYERAWSAVARGDYNLALGRLVTYKAPGLSWFHEPEVEMLRSISFLQMCIYDEVDRASIDFTNRYSSVGKEIRNLLDQAKSGSVRNLVSLFSRGIQAARDKPQSEDSVNQVLNKFVRSPYFVQLMQTGDKVRRELQHLNVLGVPGRQGLGGFLRNVLVWRWNTAQELGGKFVRDRLKTEYENLLGNVATVDIVKLEMLRKGKAAVEASNFEVDSSEDEWGQKKRGSLPHPDLRDDQFFWNFNGEFWSDELGDYVFALKPECQ